MASLMTATRLDAVGGSGVSTPARLSTPTGRRFDCTDGSEGCVEAFNGGSALCCLSSCLLEGVGVVGFVQLKYQVEVTNVYHFINVYLDIDISRAIPKAHPESRRRAGSSTVMRRRRCRLCSERRGY